MDAIKMDLNKIKERNDIKKAFIFGSFVLDRSNSNDIDVILFSDDKKRKMEFNNLSLLFPIKRIQYNCYKKNDITSTFGKTYDIVVLNDRRTLNRFIELNQNKIIEI
jgi:predicted nucleotidyltransferase